MPNVFRYSVDMLPKVIDRALSNKIPMVALFPYTNSKVKNNIQTYARNILTIPGLCDSSIWFKKGNSKNNHYLRSTIKTKDFFPIRTDASKPSVFIA